MRTLTSNNSHAQDRLHQIVCLFLVLSMIALGAAEAFNGAKLIASPERTILVSSKEDSGPNTLRQALLDVKAGDKITFDVATFSPTNPGTIFPLSELPPITVDGVSIDASNAGVILDGSRVLRASGLVVSGAQGVTIQGLQIVNFPDHGIELIKGAQQVLIGGSRFVGAHSLGQGNRISKNGINGILLRDANTSNNQVQGNLIGTDLSGAIAQGNALNGIQIGLGASGNVIGGLSQATGNLISGNIVAGISIGGAGTTNNKVLGNFIGTDITGNQPVSNTVGVAIYGASGNYIGDSLTGARNLISGNKTSGVVISSGATLNQVAGNWIGLNNAGSEPVANGEEGIYIDGNNNLIGGKSSSSRNVISGNQKPGILINYPAIENQVIGNFIGTDSSGTKAVGNGQAGVQIGFGAQKNRVGGITVGERNVIGGNRGIGVYIHRLHEDGPTITYSAFNQVLGNFIGTNVTGTAAIGNTGDGILLETGATENFVGGDSAIPCNLTLVASDAVSGPCNLISGNGSVGVHIKDANQSHILNNFIGTDLQGVNAIGNRGGGIIVEDESVESEIRGNIVKFNGGLALRYGVDDLVEQNQFLQNASNFAQVTGGELERLQTTWAIQGLLNKYQIVGKGILLPTANKWTIGAGVSVEFDYGLGANIQGALQATGAITAPIRFTSAQRFAFPLPGDWRGITFNGGSGDFQYTSVEFAQNGIEVNSGAVNIISSTVAASQKDGILWQAGALTLGVGNSFGGNGQFAINSTGKNLDVRDAWFGSASGPANLGGAGDKVSVGVTVLNPRSDPIAKNSWLTAPVLNLGVHHFTIQDEQDVHWFRIPVGLRNATMDARLNILSRDYDLFLFSGLDRDSGSPDDIGSLRGINPEGTGSLRGIPGRLASVEDCSPDYIEGLSNLGDPFNTERLLQAGCNIGNLAEQVQTGVWDQSGWYYLLVAGHNGANTTDESYTLNVTLSSGNPSDSAPLRPPLFDPPAESNSDTKTIILTNWAELEAPPSLMQAVNTLAVRPEVGGVVINLGDNQKHPEFPPIYAEWKNHRADPYYANWLTAAIKAFLTAQRSAYPNLKYILIVGGDEVIPFRRIPDEVTMANETAYAHNVPAGSALAASLANGYFLSDDYYAGFSPIPWRSREIFLPELSIGRLVETPAEIEQATLRFMEQPTLTLESAAVVGYDFMLDQAQAIAGKLSAANISNETLIRNDWLATELIELWLNHYHTLVSANAHFTHNEAIPAAQYFSAAKQVVSPGDVKGSPHQTHSIVFSIGCHSGLSVPDGNVGQVDFAQVLVGKGAAYIANTGFGYGDADAIGYSERLIQLFVEQLLKGGAVGKALQRAKIAYFHELGVRSLTPYHEKVLGVATFYGFPMLQVQLPPGLNGQPLQAADSGSMVNSVRTSDVANCPGSLKCRQFAFDLPLTQFQKHESNNGEGFYYAIGDESLQDTTQLPILPRTSISITHEEQIPAHGALFEGGRYASESDFDPVITRLVTQTEQINASGVKLPELIYTNYNWWPTSWDLINSVRAPTGIQQRLVVVPAQYRYTHSVSAEGKMRFVGEERLLTEMQYTVYYSTTTDTIPPYIWHVRAVSESSQTAQGQLQLEVGVNDIAKVVRVVAVYTLGDGVWQIKDLTQREPNSDYWVGVLPDAPTLEYFIQAVDSGGNVAIHDNKGEYFPTRVGAGFQAYLPLVRR